MIREIIDAITKKSVKRDIEKKTGNIAVNTLNEDDFQKYANQSGKIIELHYENNCNTLVFKPQSDDEERDVYNPVKFMPW
jgi:hypothetical protein